MWLQKSFRLQDRSRGFHLITTEILNQLPEVEDIKVGILYLFIKHTSASLTSNENADPTVRSDLEAHLNKIIPENAPYYQHIYEGADDMPAHIKASLIGNSVTIPIKAGMLDLGTWQGVYLGEHRDYGGKREITATIHGE